MIQFRNLSISYGGHMVLKDVNSNLGTDRMIMLVGENGTGKSTLLKSMMGFVDYEGSITFCGEEIRDMKIPARAKSFGYVAQQKPLPQHEQVEDFLLMGVAYRLSLFEQPGGQDREKVEEVLELFKLEHLKGCYMDELSGGEVQMLYVARCFVEEHEMLILDEPCASLDYHKQYAFLELMKQLLKQKKMGAIISIHDPNLALLFADYVVCLHEKGVYSEKQIRSLGDKKEMAEDLNEIYHHAFHIVEEKDEIIMQWKSQQQSLSSEKQRSQ